MSDEAKFQYRTVRPIGLSGRVEAGEIVNLTEDEAATWGPEYVEKVSDEESAADAPVVEPSSTEESETTAPDHKVGDECTTTDGVAGVFAQEGDALVCVPKEVAAEVSTEQEPAEVVEPSSTEGEPAA